MKLSYIHFIKTSFATFTLVALASSLTACGQKKAPAAPTTAAADASTPTPTDLATTKAKDKNTTTTTTPPTTDANKQTATSSTTTTTPTDTTMAPAAAAVTTTNTATNTGVAPAAPATSVAQAPVNPAQQLVTKLDNEVKEKIETQPDLEKKLHFTKAFSEYLQFAKDLNDETWRDYEGASHAHLACSAVRLFAQYGGARVGFALSKPAARLILRGGGALFRATGAARLVPQSLTSQAVLSEEGEVLHVEMSKGMQTAGKFLTGAGNLARGLLKWVVVYDIINDPDNMEFVRAFVPEMQRESTNPIDQISQNAADYEQMGLTAEDANLMATMFKYDKAHPEIDKKAFETLQEIIKRNAELNSEPISLTENVLSGCTKESERLKKVHSIYEAGQIKLEEYRHFLAEQ